MPNQLRVVTVAVVFLWVSFLQGADSTPTGGPVTAIVQYPGRPQTLYASTNGGGIFISTDAGATWKSSNIGLTDLRIADLVIDPIRPNILYTANDRELRKSIDGGSLWAEGQCCFVPGIGSLAMEGSRLHAASGARVISFNPDDLDSSLSSDTGSTILEIDVGASRIYAATHDGVFRSEGEGLHRIFRKVLGGRFSNVVVDRLDRAGTVYVGGPADDGLSSSFYRMFDGGAWVELDQLDGTVTAMTGSNSGNRGLFVAMSTGEIFALRQKPEAPVWESIYQTGTRVTALLETSDGALYAGTQDARIFRVPLDTDGPPAIDFTRLPDDDTRLPRLLQQVKEQRFVDDELASGFLIPAAGHVEGAGGELFRTDLSLLNASSTAQDVIVVWLAAGSEGGIPPSFRLTLPGSIPGTIGPAVTLADVVLRLGLSGLGSFVVFAVDANGNVSRDSSIGGSARIWSTKPNVPGSVSATNPSVDLSSLRSTARVLIGNRSNADFRTNVGIVNLGSVNHQYTVTINGQLRESSFTITVPPFSMIQRALPSGDYGHLSVVVTATDSHDWFAYGASVDNGSGDTWFTRGAAVQLRR